MKLATLACLAALCLSGPSVRAAPAEPAKAAAPAAAEPAAVPGQAAPRPASTGRAERRRRTYAACNRASHQRSLRGGRRRRFLIRCRLGYERTRGQQIQAPAPAPPPAATAPAQPGRKP